MDYRLNAIQLRYGGDKDGSGLRIRCPVHNGTDKNCAVWIDESDRIAATCHSHQCEVTKFLWHEFDPPQPKRGRISKEQRESAKWLPKEPPTDVFVAPRTFREHDYTSQWQYYDKDHTPINLVVVRYDNKTKGDKCTIPYIYAQLEDGRKLWIARGPRESVWYGAQTVAAHDTVLIVEGEKTANAAWQVVQGKMGVVTWLGGSGKTADLDLSLLDGKRIILWPDHDEPGFKWAWKSDTNLYDKLVERGNDVSLIMWDGGPGSDAADVPSAHEMWDIIQTAGPAAKYRLESLYNECLIAKEMGMDSDAAKSIPCGFGAKCIDCKYNYVPDITHPVDTLNADPVLHGHAYIVHEEVFVDLDTMKTYSQSGFNAYWCSYPGYSLAASTSPHRQFLEHSGTLKVHEREFRPGQPLIVDGKINLARTLHWEEQTQIPDLWLKLGAHLFKQKEFDHILDWLAFTIQRPEDKIEHTLLIVGDQGVGKSLFFSPIEKALRRIGQHVTVNSNEVSSSFNGFLENAKLVTLEELNMAGAGFTGSNRLKEWQAAPPDYIRINPKFAKPFAIPNIVNIIAYSNFDLPVKLEENQRRWYVVRTEAGRLEDEDFYVYDKFNEMLSDTYIDQILSHLSRREISQFKRGNAPRNEAAREMELMSIPGMREFGDIIRENNWPELVQMREVLVFLEHECGRGAHLNINHLRKILPALGWTNLEVCFKVHGKSIRPWAPQRGTLYKSMDMGALRTRWTDIQRGNAVP